MLPIVFGTSGAISMKFSGNSGNGPLGESMMFGSEVCYLIKNRSAEQEMNGHFNRLIFIFTKTSCSQKQTAIA